MLTLYSLSFDSIQDIPDLPSLQKLDLRFNDSLTNLDGIERFGKLRKLELFHNSVDNIQALQALSELVSFIASEEPFSDISALRNVPTLRIVHFRDPNITDFTPLYGLPNLSKIGAEGSDVSCVEMEKLKDNSSEETYVALPRQCRY